MSLKDTINNNVVDFLIEEIIGDNTYDNLTYWNKTSLCKLVVKKHNVSGKAIC